MGGRGSSSDFTTNFSFSVDSLSGSEKQKKWAQNIVDEAFRTINGNMKNFSKNKVTHPLAENYRKTGEALKKALSNVSSAGEIIDIRDRISSQSVDDFVRQAYFIERIKKDRKRK